jgi:hypothetical protein
MANQAIALQSRAPQTNILGPALQQGAQMVNMMRQQESLDRQTAATNQQMEIARAKEAREAALHPLQVSQTQASIDASKAAADASTIDRAGKLMDRYTLRAGQTLTPAGYDLLLKEMDKDAPEYAAFFRANLPIENFDRNTLLRMVGSIGDNFKATYGPLETEVVVMDDGTLAVARTGGFGKPGVFEMEKYNLAPRGAGTPPPAAQGVSPRPMAPAPANPMAAAPANAMAPAPAPANPMAAAPMPGPNTNPVGGAPLNIQSGNMFQPASMRTGSQMGGAQPNLSDIVNQAMSSGQISGSNLQLMRDAAGPDKSAQLDQLLKASNIQVVPDAQTGMRSAMLRGGEDSAPQMQMVQDMGDYAATGRPARGKPPMQGVMPGSALVPLPRVAAEARAGRETPGEVYAKEMARETAARDAAKRAGPKPLTPVQEAKLRENITKDSKSAQATLDMMLAPDTGVVAAVTAVRNLSESQKQSITGISSYMPALLPEARSAETALKNLRGKITQMGKAAASLGGAIGQMAVQEWKIVSDMIATLDVAEMEPADLDNQLDIIEATAKRAAQTTRDAYENQYFEEFARYPNRFVLKDPEKIAVTPGKKAESALPRVRTDADFNRLKPGTTFIDAKGERRVKPAQRVQYTPQQMAVVRSIQGGPRGAGGTQTNPTMIMNGQQYDRLPKGAWYIAENGYFAQKGSERD